MADQMSQPKEKMHPQLNFNEMEEHIGKTIPRKRERR